jgi:hypothetical protein
MLFRRWTKLLSNLMAITGVLVGTHVQEIWCLPNSRRLKALSKVNGYRESTEYCTGESTGELREGLGSD